MTWPVFALLTFSGLFAAAFIVSIGAMLGLAAVDAIGRAWRWCAR